MPSFQFLLVLARKPPDHHRLLLSSNSSSASSTVSFSVTASAVLTCGFSAISHCLCLMHKLGECPMSSPSGLLAYSTLSYSSTIGGCPVPECIAVSWAHIDVCERFHERNLRQQQRSLRFGIPRSRACMVDCSPTYHPFYLTYL